MFAAIKLNHKQSLPQVQDVKQEGKVCKSFGNSQVELAHPRAVHMQVHVRRHSQAAIAARHDVLMPLLVVIGATIIP